MGITFPFVSAWIPFIGEESHKHLHLTSNHGGKLKSLIKSTYCGVLEYFTFVRIGLCEVAARVTTRL